MLSFVKKGSGSGKLSEHLNNPMERSHKQKTRVEEIQRFVRLGTQGACDAQEDAAGTWLEMLADSMKLMVAADAPLNTEVVARAQLQLFRKFLCGERNMAPASIARPLFRFLAMSLSTATPANGVQVRDLVEAASRNVIESLQRVASSDTPLRSQQIAALRHSFSVVAHFNTCMDRTLKKVCVQAALTFIRDLNPHVAMVGLDYLNRVVAEDVRKFGKSSGSEMSSTCAWRLDSKELVRMLIGEFRKFSDETTLFVLQGIDDSRFKMHVIFAAVQTHFGKPLPQLDRWNFPGSFDSMLCSIDSLLQEDTSTPPSDTDRLYVKEFASALLRLKILDRNQPQGTGRTGRKRSASDAGFDTALGRDEVRSMRAKYSSKAEGKC